MGAQQASFAELLRTYRELAGLSQVALAARSGISEDAISMLERGVRTSPRSDTVARLGQALHLDQTQREALLAAARSGGRQADHRNGPRPALDSGDRLTEARALIASLPAGDLPAYAPLPAGSRMPLAPNPLFVGRKEELLRIAAAFEGDDATVALGQVVASTGLGGLGKTQLAVEFVHRYGQFFVGGVFWLSFASAQEIPLQVAACAGPGALGLAAGVEGLSLEERLELVNVAWRSPMPRLLVFDNCEDEALLEAWRPPSGGCRVLVTSRRPLWSPTLGVTALPLDLLPRRDSVELLRRYLPDLPRDDLGLDAVASALGDLPLALHLSGSYLRAYRAEMSLREYLVELSRPEVLRHASLLGGGLEDSPSPTHHVQSLAQTFALCLGRLDQAREVDRTALALLARMACLAPGEAVPRALLGRTLEVAGRLRRADGVRRLAAVGLLEEGEEWLRLHRLLAHFVRQEGLDPDAQPAVDRALIACARDAHEENLTVAALAPLIPHMVDVASRAAGDDTRHVHLCTAAGLALWRAGDLRAARPWLERAVDVCERAFGAEHVEVASSLVNLGELLYEQGELIAARRMQERALAMRERMLGPDHPETAVSLNKLAMVLRDGGELAAARSLLERALATRERLLGPDHADTASSLSSLAVLLDAQGDRAAARALFERALAIRERALRPGHPRVAWSLSLLGRLLMDQGEPAQGRALLERALAIRERALGPDHPEVAESLNSLGMLLRDQGDLAAARPLIERALDIRERVSGPEHPETAAVLNSLGVVLQRQGDPVAARRLFERSLAIRERRLGPDHPRTALGLKLLGRLLLEQGDVAAARPLLERALAIRQSVLGPDHPDTASSVDDLAALRRTQASLISGGGGEQLV
jgi:tetratricopeptide (TPR) repeat protein/transcriptional regulator with XRE-family HTH domain